MWFEDLMDDCKQALTLITSNIWISLPYVVHALVVTIGSIILFVGFVMVFVFTTLSFSHDPMADVNWLLLGAGLLGGIALTSLLTSALSALTEAGSLHLFAAVAAGEKPSSQLFWLGVRSSFLSMWGITLFLNFLAIILSPVLLAILGLLLAAGILSGGWALLAAAAIVTVFLGAWPAALVLDKQGGFKALASGFRLGRRYFWGLFILALAAALLGQQLSAAFGPLVAILAGWILAVIVRSWSKMTILLIYKRHSSISQ